MRLPLGFAVLTLIPALAAHAASFTATSQSAVYDPITQLVQFEVVFNQVPDFKTTDQYGRQADSFQYYILTSGSTVFDHVYDSVIRGSAIYTDPKGLPIRYGGPPSSDPNADGWGAIRDEVAFTLNGNSLAFAVPLRHLYDGPGVVFTYSLQTLQYGAAKQYIDAQDTIATTPEPSSFALLGTGLLGVAGVIRKRSA